MADYTANCLIHWYKQELSRNTSCFSVYLVNHFLEFAGVVVYCFLVTSRVRQGSVLSASLGNYIFINILFCCATASAVIQIDHRQVVSSLLIIYCCDHDYVSFNGLQDMLPYASLPPVSNPTA